MGQARRKSQSEFERVKSGHPFLFGASMQTFPQHWQLSCGCTAAVIEIIRPGDLPGSRCGHIRYRARIMISTTYPLSSKPRRRLDLAVKDLERFVEMMHAAFSGYLAHKWLRG